MKASKILLFSVLCAALPLYAQTDPEEEESGWSTPPSIYQDSDPGEQYLTTSADPNGIGFDSPGSFELLDDDPEDEIPAVLDDPGLEVTPDIVELARGLKYDPLRIYHYVKFEVESELYFGLKKGPRLTYLEESGNDLDKACLLKVLLDVAKINNPGGFTEGGGSVVPKLISGKKDYAYEATNGTTPDICSLWRLDTDAMEAHSAGFYASKTPYLITVSGTTPNWNDSGQRRISLALSQAVSCGYSNRGRISVVGNYQELRLTRFFVKLGSTILDPWDVRYEKVEPNTNLLSFNDSVDLSTGSAIDSLCQGTVGTDNFWRAGGDDRDYQNAVASFLESRCNDLFGTLKNATHFGQVSSEELLGGYHPVRSYSSSLSAADCSSEVTLDAGGGSEFLARNVCWRLLLKLGAEGIQNEIAIPTLGGRRISVFYDAKPAQTGDLVLGIERTPFGSDFSMTDVARASVTYFNKSAPLSSKILLPFQNDSPFGANISYKRNDNTAVNQQAFSAMVYGCNPKGGLLRARQTRLDQILQTIELTDGGAGATTDETGINWSLFTDEKDLTRALVLETLNIHGLSWLQQANLSRKGISSYFGANIDKLISFGRMTQDNGYYIDVYQQLSVAFGRSGEYNGAGSALAARYAAMLVESALEHSVIEQANGTYDYYGNVPPGASTVSINAAPFGVEYGVGSNTPLFGVVTEDPTLNLPGYPPDGSWPAITSYMTKYQTLAAQYSYFPPAIVAMRRDGMAKFSWVQGGQPYDKTAQGMAFLGPAEVRMSVNGGNGGYSLDNSPIEPFQTQLEDSLKVDYFEWSSVGKYAKLAASSSSILDGYGADPVNLANGSFDHAETDLVVGSGKAPKGMTFERYYSSARAHHNRAGLGYGWTHNWDIRVEEHSIATAGLGDTIPRHMVPYLVAVASMKDCLLPPEWTSGYGSTIVPETINPKRWLVVNYIAKWAADQLTANAVTLTMGRESETFYRRPDGGYESSAGSTMTLSNDEQSSGIVTVHQRHGNTIEFYPLYSGYVWLRGKARSLTGPYGQEVNFTYNVKGVSKVEVAEGSSKISLTFSYGANGSEPLESVTDNAGRTVAFSYLDEFLSTSVDPENHSPVQSELSGGASHYYYQIPGSFGVKCCLSKIVDPLGRIVVANNYDPFCRVVSQDSANVELGASPADEGGPFDFIVPWRFYYSGIENSEVNPLGDQKIYSYDVYGRLVSTVDEMGYEDVTEYDQESRVVLKRDALGRRIETDYDLGHNPIEVREFRNAVTTAPYVSLKQYDLLNRVVYEVDSLSRATSYTYPSWSSANAPETVTRGGKTTVYQYYGIGSGFRSGLVQSVTDRDSRVTQYLYDDRGNRTQETLPGGYMVKFQNYSLAGDPGKVIDPSNGEEVLTYNNRRQLIERIKVDRTNSSYKIWEKNLYNAAGQEALAQTYTGRGQWNSKEIVTSATDKPISITYSGSDGVLGTSDDVSESWTYDVRDFEESYSDIKGNVTSQEYLANGWAYKRNLPADPMLGARETSKVLDAVGRTKNSYDVLQRETVTSYSEHETYLTDHMGTLMVDRSDVVDPENYTSTSISDAAGNLRAVVDRRGHRYEFSYDDLDRELDLWTPEGRKFSSTYEGEGSPLVVTKTEGAASTAIVNAYNAVDGRLSSSTFKEDGVVVSSVGQMSYDARGNLLSSTESGKTISRTYDDFDRVRTYTNEDGYTIGYEYYSDGLLKKLYYPGAQGDSDPFNGNLAVHYEYDEAGRLTKITDWNNKITSYGWSSDGRLLTISRPNGTQRALQYDDLKRISGITEREASGELLLVNQLHYRKTEELSSSFSAVNPPISSVYDAGLGLSGGTFDMDNGVQSINGLAHSYDERGNMVSGVVDTSGSVASLEFDSRDRLVGVDSTVDSSYVYDHEGLRKSIQYGSDAYYYGFDPHGGPLVRLLFRKGPGNSLTRYVYGIGLAYEVTEGSAQERYYHYDFCGSTAVLTDASGGMTDQFDYTPYGQVARRSGSTETPFKFAGFLGVLTDPSGLISMRARFYSPILRKFLSMDPARFDGGSNWYAYASGNPMSLGDPTGFGAERTLDALQMGLSALGMLPAVGFVFDLANAGISFARGNYGDGLMNLVSALPGIGQVAAGAKLGATAAAGYGAYKGIKAARNIGRAEHVGAEALSVGRGASRAPRTGLTNPELIQKAGQKAFDKIPGKGGAVGTARHEYATKLLERYQGIYGDKGLRFKETRSLFGQKSILDARDINSKTIYDWKFGNSARMSPAQRAKYQSHYPDHTIQVEKYLYP
ncbi:RHS repeat-associated core domain-containing protein [Haloferula sargassicola]